MSQYAAEKNIYSYYFQIAKLYYYYKIRKPCIFTCKAFSELILCFYGFLIGKYEINISEEYIQYHSYCNYFFKFN